jgi:hypothetical protein
VAEIAAMTTRRFTLPTVTETQAVTAHPSPDAWPSTLQQRFEALQARLSHALAADRARVDGRSVVVVCSRVLDKWHEPPALTKALEERLLGIVLGLRDPGLSVVYVTSMPIEEEIVGYYLAQLPAGLRWSARARLTLVSLDDDARRPLSQKLLDRPDVIAQIRAAIPDRALCHLVPFATTAFDRDLALGLGIPMDGADPRHARLGTKSGCRELFARAGVEHPVGVENLDGVDSAVAAIAWLRARKPEITELVIKLNEGVAGEGNGIIDLRGLPPVGADDERTRIAERLERAELEAEGVPFEAYAAKLAERGGIVEERIRGAEVRSPSVQMQITPEGDVELLSTHDQLLGGPSGHSYHGCAFPADAAYARDITAMAAAVGRELAALGVVGRCAVDFVTTRGRDGRWHSYGIELNLRKGGTTHPYVLLGQLVGGAYDATSAKYVAADGAPKHYVATDHLDVAVGSLDASALARLATRHLPFDHVRGSGIVLHMLSSAAAGRIGFTAIADTARAAQRLYDHACATVYAAAASSAALTEAA